ncbi:MAG: hypothetical protein FE78DRAFT_139497, partial [Acidomyces sp. 'richmondensis']
KTTSPKHSYESNPLLHIMQDLELVGRIRRLFERALPPTLRLFAHIAAEVFGRQLSKEQAITLCKTTQA